jgi:hypothetical protein
MEGKYFGVLKLADAVSAVLVCAVAVKLNAVSVSTDKHSRSLLHLIIKVALIIY